MWCTHTSSFCAVVSTPDGPDGRFFCKTPFSASTPFQRTIISYTTTSRFLTRRLQQQQRRDADRWRWFWSSADFRRSKKYPYGADRRTGILCRTGTSMTDASPQRRSLLRHPSSSDPHIGAITHYTHHHSVLQNKQVVNHHRAPSSSSSCCY